MTFFFNTCIVLVGVFFQLVCCIRQDIRVPLSVPKLVASHLGAVNGHCFVMHDIVLLLHCFVYNLMCVEYYMNTHTHTHTHTVHVLPSPDRYMQYMYLFGGGGK